MYGGEQQGDQDENTGANETEPDSEDSKTAISELCLLEPDNKLWVPMTITGAPVPYVAFCCGSLLLLHHAFCPGDCKCKHSTRCHSTVSLYALPLPCCCSLEPWHVLSPVADVLGFIFFSCPSLCRTHKFCNILSNASLHACLLPHPLYNPLSSSVVLYGSGPKQSTALRKYHSRTRLVKAMHCVSVRALPGVTKVWLCTGPGGKDPPPRSGHSCTPLPHGRLLIFGGVDDKGSYKNDMFIVDTKRMTWYKLAGTAKGAPPKPRAWHSYVSSS